MPDESYSSSPTTVQAAEPPFVHDRAVVLSSIEPDAVSVRFPKVTALPPGVYPGPLISVPGTVAVPAFIVTRHFSGRTVGTKGLIPAMPWSSIEDVP